MSVGDLEVDRREPVAGRITGSDYRDEGGNGDQAIRYEETCSLAKPNAATRSRPEGWGGFRE